MAFSYRNLSTDVCNACCSCNGGCPTFRDGVFVCFAAKIIYDSKRSDTVRLMAAKDAFRGYDEIPVVLPNDLQAMIVEGRGGIDGVFLNTNYAPALQALQA